MYVASSELIGALKAALLFASTDETRASLNAVHLEPMPGTLRVVATDGHTMWCCEIPAQDSSEDPPPANAVTWDVPVEDVEKIVRTLVPREQVQVLLSKRTIGGEEFAASSAVFPRYQLVIPALSKPGKILPEYLGEYVSRCCDALALYGKGFAPEVPKTGPAYEKDAVRDARRSFLSPPIAWRTGSDMDPVFIFSPKFPAAFALVMPRRSAVEKAGAEQFIERVREGKKSSKVAA